MFNLFKKETIKSKNLKRFKIADMHCSSCALTIDMELEDLDGVKSSKTSYAKGETEVEIDPGKVNLEEIIKAIKKSGYTAAEISNS